MGLFKFLKEKFGKKHDTETEVEVKEEVVSEPSQIEAQKESFNDEKIVSEPVVQKIEEPKVEEIEIVEPEVEQPKIEEAPVVEQPKIEDTKVEETPAAVEPKVEEAPINEEPRIEEKNILKTEIIEPKKEEPIQEEVTKLIPEDKQEEKPVVSKSVVEEKPAPVEDTRKTKKYVKGMEKSRHNFADRIEKLSKKYRKVNQEYFEQLEEILIEADVGVNLTLKVIDDVITESKAKKIDDAEEINELVIDRLFEGYMNSGERVGNDIRFQNDGPTVLLVAGVNGVGKTTTIAKLANRYIKQGKKVMLCAADTFRAGAIEQLSIWAQRLGCPIVVGKPESDPASVAYEGARRARVENVDLLIVDTAGRLQNKINLMNELAKISRVISKEIPNSPHEVFLVIDATTGQNGVVQAKQFLDCIKLTGIVITKMDGTSKGGIILAIRDELGIPVRFIGLGESMDDLQEFDLERYLVGLLIGDVDE